MKARKAPRNNRVTLMLNDSEEKVLNKFIKKYNIVNKSQFVRETLFRFILEQNELDHPKLFNENEMR